MANEYLIPAFISKIVNDGIDCTKNAIKKAIEQKAKGQNTLHVQMYSVIVETIEDIAASHYKYDKNNIYAASAEFLKLAKNEQGDIIYKIEKSLTVLDISYDMNDCDSFKRLLLEKLICDENQQLYRAIILIQNYEKSLKTETSKANNDNLCNKQQNKFQNNKKKIYCDMWNQSMFLQHKDPGRIVRLRDAFVVPNYHIHEHKIGHNEDDTLESFIDKFIDYQGRSTMLITGVPGIGKSSIVSWIANKYKEDDRVIILRFRDWDKEDLEYGILNAVKKTLECNKMDLNYKTFILDGFDEIKSLENREKLLQDFLNVILDFDLFKCIITSRPHYIQTIRFDNHIELAPFDPTKIGEFYEKIKGVKLNETINEDYVDVYGIPVILYMCIMCDLDITEQSSKPEIYNRVFAENGGIFDRFYFDKKAYSEGAHILRNADNIEIYLTFLRETAYKLFKSKKGEELKLQDCDIPTLMFEQENINILEFPLKPLFESIEKVEFVHYSIYEYFLSEYIFVYFKKVINKKKEELAGIFGVNFKDRRISPEVLEFLQYKIRRSELNDMYEIVFDTFKMMLRDGMTYYINEHCKPIISCEKCIFENMLDFLHIWEIDYIKLDESIRDYLLFKYIFLGINLVRVDLSGLNLNDVFLERADLRKAKLLGTDLRGADLRNADLRGVKLRGADLTGADLREAKLLKTDLRGADLRDTNLRRAGLRGADLRGANLRRTDLIGADLNMVIFDETQVKYLEKNYNLKYTRVRIDSTNEIISYEEYCKRRNM